MTRTQRLFLCLALAALCSRFAVPAVAQFPQINLEIAQLGQHGAPPTYNVRLFPLFAGAGTVSVYTPDGTLLNPNAPGGLTANTRAQFEARFLGAWSIVEDPFNPMTPNSTFNFTLSSFLDDVFTETATIESPLDGSSVPPDFPLVWKFPSGATPVARAIRYSPGGAPVDAEFDPAPAPSAQFHVDLATYSGAPLNIRAGTSTLLSPYFSAVTRQSGSSATSYSFNQPRFFNFSPQVSVNIVPEPSAALLSASALVVASLMRISCRRLPQLKSDNPVDSTQLARG